MRKGILLGILVYIGIQILLKSGYKNPQDADYYIDDASPIPVVKENNIDSSIHHYPLDSTKRNGQWVDPD